MVAETGAGQKRAGAARPMERPDSADQRRRDLRRIGAGVSVPETDYPRRRQQEQPARTRLEYILRTLPDPGRGLSTHQMAFYRCGRKKRNETTQPTTCRLGSVSSPSAYPPHGKARFSPLGEKDRRDGEKRNVLESPTWRLWFWKAFYKIPLPPIRDLERLEVA